MELGLRFKLTDKAQNHPTLFIKFFQQRLYLH